MGELTGRQGMSDKSGSTVNIGGGGLGAALLTGLFVWLKVEGKIDWSWWLVFSPMWGGLAIVLTIFAVLGIIVLIAAIFDK
jgi:hypothetical protein